MRKITIEVLFLLLEQKIELSFVFSCSSRTSRLGSCLEQSITYLFNWVKTSEVMRLMTDSFIFGNKSFDSSLNHK